MRFDGETYDPARDGARLGRQMRDVLDLMLPGAWWTLAEISAATGHPESSVSARIRDMRKPRFGYVVEREHVGRGLHRYRVRARRCGQGVLFGGSDG